eukprot:EG_transcript_32502
MNTAAFFEAPLHLSTKKQTYFTAIDGLPDNHLQKARCTWLRTLMAAVVGIVLGLLSAHLLLTTAAHLAPVTPDQQLTLVDVLRDAGKEVSDKIPDNLKRPAVLVPAAFGLGYLGGSNKVGEKALRGAADVIHSGKQAVSDMADAAAEKVQDALDYAGEHPVVAVAGAAATAVAVPAAIGVAKAIREEDAGPVPHIVKKG